MEVTITEQDKVMTATLSGRLDTLASQDVMKQVQPMLEHADCTLVLDCKDLTYISSSGLRIFLTLRKAASAQGGKVVVRSICDEIRQVFMMTGFLNLFEIED